MTLDLLFLIMECEKINIRICAIVSDQGNPTLCSQLELLETNRFNNPYDGSRMVYNFFGKGWY